MIFTDLFKNVSNVDAKKIAFIDYEKRYSFEEIEYRASKIKHFLKSEGIRKGDRIAILMSNSFRYMELIFGITAIGAIIVPLNIRLHTKELIGILNDAKPKLIYIGAEYYDDFIKVKSEIPSLETMVIVNDTEKYLINNKEYDYEKIIDSLPNEKLIPDDVNENDIAGLYYTSGTTGRPKGVIHTHRSLIYTSRNYSKFMKISKDDVWLHTAPMYHIGGIMMFLAYTKVGATQVVLKAFNPKEFLQMVENEKITSTFLVPTMINMLLNDEGFDNYNKESIKRIVYSSAPISVELLKKALEKLPHVKFSQVFGATEVPMFITLSEKYHTIPRNEEERKILFSCGKPFEGMEAKIMNEDGEELSDGVVGEIVAKGPTLAKGYWGLIDETEKVFKDDGWYFTGDLGYRDENGFYYIVDRAKDMIISGGENIYSIEVEEALYGHPGVLECAVVGVPHEKWGEIVKAVIVRKPGYDFSEEEIITFTKERLAKYKVPKSIDFVDELPKNSIGKIQKHLLRKNIQMKRS